MIEAQRHLTAKYTILPFGAKFLCGHSQFQGVISFLKATLEENSALSSMDDGHLGSSAKNGESLDISWPPLFFPFSVYPFFVLFFFIFSIFFPFSSFSVFSPFFVFFSPLFFLSPFSRSPQLTERLEQATFIWMTAVLFIIL